MPWKSWLSSSSPTSSISARAHLVARRDAIDQAGGERHARRVAARRAQAVVHPVDDVHQLAGRGPPPPRHAFEIARPEPAEHVEVGLAASGERSGRSQGSTAT